MESLRLFWFWWREHLLLWLPGYAERALGRASDGVILADPRVAADGGDGSVWAVERRNGVDQDLGRVGLDPAAVERLRAGAARNRLPIVLRLPGQALLERDVALPLAAERELSRVLFYEMDRFTPFSAAEVFWTHLLRHRDRAQGKITVRLAVVQRALAGPVIESLAVAGVPVSCLELPGADGQMRRIFLDEAEGAGAAPERLLRPAIAAVAVLLLAVIALPFLQQGWASAEVERRIAAVAPTVAEVRRLRGAATAGGTGSDVVAAERKKQGDALEAIALLTDALPDNTYLTARTFDGGKLTMDGQSKSAAALIAPLTANRRLQDASFTAPVVRNTLGLDSFSLGLRVTR